MVFDFLCRDEARRNCFRQIVHIYNEHKQELTKLLQSPKTEGKIANTRLMEIGTEYLKHVRMGAEIETFAIEPVAAE